MMADSQENNNNNDDNNNKNNGNEKDDDTPQEDWQIQRDEYKASGDGAFRVGAYKTAIDEYTKALSLDPDCVIVYSNRSAAYLSNGEKSKALKDAQRCIELDPTFIKGYSRLGAALFALKRYEPAKLVYQQLLDRDGNNIAAKQGIEACDRELQRILEQQQQEEHDILGSDVVVSSGNTKTDNGRPESQQPPDSSNNNNNHGDPQDNDKDDDDSLADFFEEVEDVVASTKTTNVESASSSTTNAIRNDRAVLGTVQEQIDRLLQPRYEWRNLNPYFVLQLPAATATDEDISRRYKALSLLLHPDKNRTQQQHQQQQLLEDIPTGTVDTVTAANAIAAEWEARVQLAYDQVQKAKTILSDPDRKKYIQSLVAEGMKMGEWKWVQEQKKKANKKKNKQQQPWTLPHQKNDDDDNEDSLEAIQDREVMRIFAQVEHKRREVEERERNYEQRERQQEDDALEKERQARQFDKKWRDEERVGKRVGNWRDFSSSSNSSSKKKAKP